MITMEYFIKSILSVTVCGYMRSLLSVSYALQYEVCVGEFYQVYYSNALNISFEILN